MRNLSQKKMKDKLVGIVIISLVGLVFFQRGCEKGSEAKGPDTLVVHDTTWKTYEKTIVKQVPISKEIPVPYEVQVTKYQADTSYPKLKAQYETLVKQYAAKRIYNDSVAVGTYGHIKLTDTVSENKLGKRTFKENYKIPEVTKTVTITKYAEPTRQLYVGGGINATSLSSFRSAEGGILYKTKRDQIFGAKVGVNTDGSITYGVQSYWKIKLKK
jgi:hypothetical protein